MHRRRPGLLLDHHSGAYQHLEGVMAYVIIALIAIGFIVFIMTMIWIGRE